MEVEAPSRKKVDNIIRNLKNNKSPGTTKITVEMVKAEGKMLHERMHVLIIKVWEEERLPEDWTKARICPLHKKGHKQLCENGALHCWRRFRKYQLKVYALR